jgi:hypothetical protein
MYIEELLEVAIGLVFVWLVLALACMGVQEWIAGLFRFRARDLEKAIRGMLEEPPESTWVLGRFWAWVVRTFGGLWASIWHFLSGKKKDDDSFTGRLYDHQLIRALAKPDKKPSYIPARTFALALFDVATTAGTDASVIRRALDTWEKKLEHLQKGGKIPPEAREAVREKLDDLTNLVGKASNKTEFLTRLKEKIDQIKGEIENDDELGRYYKTLEPVLDKLLRDTMLEQITWGAVELAASSPRAAQALQSLIVGAEAYAEKGENVLAVTRTNAETWFNDTMDRLTGWYKLRSQMIGAVLGVAFAIALNVDTVAIATTLWREPAVRQALAAQAEKFKLPDETEATDPATAIKEFRAQFEGLRLPIGWVPLELDPGQYCTWRWWYPADRYTWGLPIGEKCWAPLDTPEGIPRDGGYVLPKLLGVLISGVAASLGAPFWFDILKKLTNVRLEGKNPAEEKPKAGG